MPIPIKFSADMTAVRAAIDSVINDTSTRDAVINVKPGGEVVGAGGRGPKANAVLPGGFVSASMAGKTPDPVEERGFGNRLSAAVQAVSAPGGAAATLGGAVYYPYGRGFGAFPVTSGASPQPMTTGSPYGGLMSSPMAGNVPGWPGNVGSWGTPVVPTAGPGGKPAAPANPPLLPPFVPARPYTGGFLFGGTTIPRVIGFGTALNIASQSLTAEREYNIASTLAMGDQRGQLDATLAFRDRITQTGGFIGRFMAYAQDPSGNIEAGIRAQLSAATGQDTRTRVMGENYIEGRKLEDRAETLSYRTPYARAMAELRTSRETAFITLNTKQREYERLQDDEIKSIVTAELTTDRSEIVRRAKILAGPKSSPQEWNDALDAAESAVAHERVTALRTERYGAAERTVYGPARRAQQRIFAAQEREAFEAEGYRLDDLRKNTEREMHLSRLTGAGMVHAARIFSVDAEGQDRVEAAFRRGETYFDIARIGGAALAASGAARSTYAHERAVLSAHLDVAARAYQYQIKYQPFSAESSTAAGEAIIEAGEIKRSGDPANAAKRLQLGILQQRAMRAQVLDSFHGVEVDPTLTSFSGPRAGEGVEQKLDTINTSIRELITALTGGDAAAKAG